MPRHRALMAVLIVAAVPWHNIQVELYPSALAGSLALIGLLTLEKALQRGTLALGVLAGLFFGLGQNFRTEFLLLPGALCCLMWLLRRLRVVQFASVFPMVAAAAVALAMQIPWALFYRAETGRLSFTESNFGHVLYVSLGSHPANPWGIRGIDEAAQQALDERRHKVSSLSDAGSKLLIGIVQEKVAEHPKAVLQRTLQQLKNTIIAPFNWGEPRLDEQGRQDLDVLREELKSYLGVGVNAKQLADYREQGLIARARGDTSAFMALAYQAVTVGAGSLVLLAGLAGIGLVLFRPAFRPQSPLLYLLGGTACYKISQDVLLCYQINYLNNVYPMVVPFAAISVGELLSRIRTRVSVRMSKRHGSLREA